MKTGKVCVTIKSKKQEFFSKLRAWSALLNAAEVPTQIQELKLCTEVDKYEIIADPNKWNFRVWRKWMGGNGVNIVTVIKGLNFSVWMKKNWDSV